MKAQIPAEGILLHKDWGDAKSYIVTCDCGCNDHSQDVTVEADETGISVNVFTRVKSDWTQRWRTIWTLLTQGYVEYDASIILSRQQTLNYAKVLQTAVKDVDEFRKQKENVKNQSQ